jgi:uncharacterized ion transporter superfamily protein YfcC
MVLLLACVAIAAVCTWILPAGEFDRRSDEATGRELVVAGTYRTVQAAPVSPLSALVGVPRGMVAAADVIISILIVGGAFALVDQLGTLSRGAGMIVQRFAGRGLWAIPCVAFAFASFGAMENMQEEIIALVPVLLVLGRGLGVDAVTVVAMSTGAAAVGAAFGPSNPYQAGIALKLAQLPLLSGGGVRLAMFVMAFVVWVLWIVRYARRTRQAPDAMSSTAGESSISGLTARDVWILGVVLLAFALYVVGVIAFGWGFNELSALFFLAGGVIGVLGGLGLSNGMAAFLKGMESMVGASLLVGAARAISVVLTDGRVIDTIVQSLANPLMDKPPALAALLMIPIHAVIHVAVPSVSGQAALTMPVLVPASDLIGLSRQATVMAYQTGAGLAELLTPTNGALMAVLLAARVPFQKWVGFVLGGWTLLTLVGIAGTLFAAWML